jgi:hypothetical protein
VKPSSQFIGGIVSMPALTSSCRYLVDIDIGGGGELADAGKKGGVGGGLPIAKPPPTLFQNRLQNIRKRCIF